jgi:diacylglycerol kinase (ATP)
MRGSRFVESFNAAIEGFFYVLRTQKNMRVHVLFTILIILLGVYLNFTRVELLVLCGTITLVLATEMLNTTVELMVDMLKSEFHPLARVVKDVAAGSVLVTSVNAVVVGYVLFVRRLPFSVEDGLMNIRKSPWHITFICLILVMAFVILGKIFFHKGTPLRGGMPSGHAAIAFSMWTIIMFLTASNTIIALSFIMAFLIARHRVKDGVHTIWEVIAGAILGVLTTLVVFQLLL